MSEVQTPRIIQKTLTLADTEYSIVFPLGTTSFTVQCRTAYDVRRAWVSGIVATPTVPSASADGLINSYATIKSSSAHTLPERIRLPTGTRTIYMASSQAAVVVEIELCSTTGDSGNG